MKAQNKNVTNHGGHEMKIKIAILGILLIFTAVTINAAGLSSARATAMGGAHMGLAKGVVAPLYNPANLGLAEYKDPGLLLVGAGVQVDNNSFSLNDYNTYTGALLSQEDKDEILGKVPVEGLKLTVDGESSAMSFSFGNFAFTITGTGAGEVNLGKDALELFFNGVAVYDTFNLDDMYGEAISYGSANISYGKSIYKSGTRELAVGATMKYIYGFSYSAVTEVSGGVSMAMDGYYGDGTMIARTALGGSGFGLDVGAAYKLNDRYTVGLTFENLMGVINWNKNTEEHGYHFEFDTLTIDNMEDDSIVVDEDWSEEIAGFKTNLPVVLKAGIASTKGKLNWAVDYIQGFKTGAGVSTKSKIAIGAEYRLIGLLPLRAGYSVGGGHGPAVSGGLGLDFSLLYIDLAVSNHSFMSFNNAKGLHFAVATGIRF